MSSEEIKPKYIFKNENFQHSVWKGSKKKTWRNLKQIIAAEKTSLWPENAVLYSGIDAPPSFTPSKKYSDVSGLPALYTDPQTKLRYYDSNEFYRIRDLPMDIVNGLLDLRKANSIVA